MKKIALMFLISLLTTSLIACSSSKQTISSEKKTIGYIVNLNKASQRILVIWSINKDEISTKSVDDLVKEARPNAVWFNIKDETNYKKLKIGQKVAVKASSFEDSYPAQADANEVEILSK